MANLVHDFVKESTSTTGTGTVTLTEVSGFARFSEAFSEGDTVYYTIQDGNDRETGIGTIGAGNTLARTTVHTTLVSGTFDDTSPSAISLSGTNCFVYCSTTKQFFDLKLDNLDAVSEVVNTGTIVDVFIYDVSKDHNPNWVNECGHTSWYNETLNTATRGKTKAFPKVALIVAESDTVTIYDATDSSLPMWMVFNAGSGLSIAGGVNPLVSIKMLNGILYSASSGTGAVSTVNFIDDSSFWRINSASLYYPHNGLVTRDDSISTVITGYFSEPLSDRDFNALAVTTDPSTGKNIVFVGSDGGLDRIDTSDNSVSSWTDDGNTVDNVNNVAVIDDYVYWSTDNTTDSKYTKYQSAMTTLTDGRYTTDPQYHGLVSYGTQWTTTGRHPIHYGSTNSLTQDLSHNAIATNRSLTLLKPNYTEGSEGSGLICTITGGDNAFTSGWQFGDIKGAFLGDTSTDSLSGSELVTNGTFDTDTTGWTAFGATLSISSGELVITVSGTESTGQARQSFSTVIGKTYMVSLEGKKILGNADFLLGTSVGGSQYINSTDITSTSLTEDTFTFVATTTTTYLSLRCTSGLASNTAGFDNVSVVQATPDMSYNNNGLKAVGSITKSAVATGAELTCASGFSSSNYFYQPYNANLDFGTDAFYISVWVNSNDTDGGYIVDFRSGSGTSGYRLYNNSAGFVFIISEAAANSILTSTTDIEGLGWVHLGITRNAGVLTAYLNGVVDTTISGTDRDTTNSSATLRLFYSTANDFLFTGSIALLRISGGTPTATQIQEIYESEKHLFRDNAEFTTSQLDITAIAYDSTTKELIESTASGWTKRHDGQIVKHDSGADSGTVIDIESNYTLRGE